VTALDHHGGSVPRGRGAAMAGAFLLAIVLSFLAGRASVGRSPLRSAGPALEKVAKPKAPPPWSTQGFRDEETARDTCVTVDCNG
jgi:hypothetical protein